MASCKSCDAPIEWCESATTGKAIPLDREPALAGNLVIVHGKALSYTDEDARLGRARRTSHFATCPDAQRWRARR